MASALRQVIVYAPCSSVQKWIDEELFGETCEVRPMESLALAVETLFSRDGLRKILVVDVDALGLDELTALENAWGLGAPLVGLGHVPHEMHDALHLNYVVRRPFGSEKLRAIISGICDGGDTVETSPIAAS